MRSRAVALLAVALALVSLAAAVRLAVRASVPRLEIARVKPTRLLPGTAERLSRLDAAVVLTWFASSPENVPSRFRGLREEVAALLESLARASQGRLRWELADPDASPELAAYASQCQVKPLRVRTVAHDAWNERSLWSSLSIAYGARPRTQIAGITPEDVGLLQAWIVAQLDELERPRRPRIALDSPARGYARLEQRLGRAADLVRTTLGGGGGVPADADLVVWVADDAGDPGVVRELLELLDSGVSVVVAGSRWHARTQPTPLRIGFEDTGFGSAGVLSTLGLTPLPGPVLDELCETVAGPRGRLAQPWRVRCIAPNQDFRALAGQPNGTLVFEAPSAFLPDAGRLEELALDFVPIATAGPDARVLPPPEGPVEVAAQGLRGADATPAPKPTLAALLAPRDPRRGSLVLLGSTSVLRDGELERDDTAHAALVDVLLANLTAPSRLVTARLRSPVAQRLPPLEPGERRLWRVLCVALPPAVFLLALVIRAGRGLRRGAARRVATSGVIGAVALVGLAGVVALARDRSAGRIDLTRGSLHELAPQTRSIAAGLQAPLRAELVFSRALPPEIAGVPARVEDLLRELARSLPVPLEVRRTSPEELTADELGELAARGAAALSLRVRAADETSVQRVRAALLLSCAGRQVALAFPDAASSEPLELRLALALGRLAGDPRARGRVVVVSDTPRLSPAEAHLEYQLEGRFAPTGADVYALARQVLERIGFEVVPRAPTSTEPLPETDLLIWFQPRRGIEPTLTALAHHLHAGGRALVAAQHYNVRSRQLAEQGFRTVHWPEPQFADLERGWLAELGVRLVREVLCDSNQASLALPTEVQRASGGRDWVLQESTQPFQLRALASRFASRSPLVAGLDDQLFLWGNRIELDRTRLERAGLAARVLMETGDETWAVDWQGGFLDPRTLAGPPAGGALGPQPLAVVVSGRFPALGTPPGTTPGAAAPGELVLIGCSEMFKAAHLVREPFRADRLLVDVVATLALGEDYGRIAGRRAVSPGFEPPASERRLALRVLVVGAWPALLLVLALVWRGLRTWRTTPGVGRHAS